MSDIPSVELSITVSLIGANPQSAEPFPYPNPFNPNQRPITFEYKLDADSEVTLTVYDLFGQEVWQTSIAPGSSGGRSGFNTVQWNGKNGEGRTVAVGVYVVQVKAVSNGQTVKSTKKFGVFK